MPRIFDNIEANFLTAIRDSLKVSYCADFCVGYFNLRGWRAIADLIDRLPGGSGTQCRLLVGMQRLPHEEMREAFMFHNNINSIDNNSVARLKKILAEEFKQQLIIGIPTIEDEKGLRELANQLRTKKLIVKLYLRSPLHAKLYLMFRNDPINPIIGYLGSSNLTQAGLSAQGELDIDVMDYDATKKLSAWFENKWQDRWCVDISQELINIIDDSWARETLIPPYYIYIKMAYHLSQEARSSFTEFRIPSDFGNQLFDYQLAAVKIAASHVRKRGGVILGDVVGLGKTLMATAVARILQDDYQMETLAICPKNLVSMWQDYFDRYRLLGKVLPLTRVIAELPSLRRYRTIIIDESHNLRNNEGKRYRAIKEYIQSNDSKCILLSATPYNKSYLDLSNQLRLFLDDERDIGVRPEMLIKEIGESNFKSKYQCPIQSITAFEKSSHADDWKNLMRLYMVRRTRSFIQDNYAKTDTQSGRKYQVFEDGKRLYFPKRIPKTIKFKVSENDSNDQYGRLFSSKIVEIIGNLKLPRYGLGNYQKDHDIDSLTSYEIGRLKDLSRAGKRLMGFCRTNLFKRLESSGYVFLQSIERHIIRNYVYIYAIESNNDLPIGTQSINLIDFDVSEEDMEILSLKPEISELEDEPSSIVSSNSVDQWLLDSSYKSRAKEIYKLFAVQYKSSFGWLKPSLFKPSLKQDLLADTALLLEILKVSGEWVPANDTKLQALLGIIKDTHPNEKVLVFSQYSDTVKYLIERLEFIGISNIVGVTGDTDDPALQAWLFSPESNSKSTLLNSHSSIRVLISTDVLSEGQNLQDSHIVVNYDLPWAIVKLAQRAGRVDRIGQKADSIFCYSFLPADGVESVLRLRSRVRRRLVENAEVLGTDEAFFEDELEGKTLLDLYSEKSYVLEDNQEEEVDLTSYAYQVWKNATEKYPELQDLIPALPSVVHSTRYHVKTLDEPNGALVYLRNSYDNDTLIWLNEFGDCISRSPFDILKAAECSPSSLAVNRSDHHYALLTKAAEIIASEDTIEGGQLGRPSSPRYKIYSVLMRYFNAIKGSLFDNRSLKLAIDEIYHFPLKPSAAEIISRNIRMGASDDELAKLVISFYNNDSLCFKEEEVKAKEHYIICSMGLTD